MSRASYWQNPIAAIVAGGIIMGFALGTRHVQGLFLVPVTMDTGWSREAFSFAIAVQNLVWGLAQPFTGMVADRFGSGKVLFAGLILYAIGLFCMSQAATPLLFSLSAGAALGVALSGTAFGMVYGALSRIVPPERRSWALGVAGAIGGIGQFVMVPAVQGLIGSIGWNSALLALACVAAALLPLSIALRDRHSGAASASAQQSLSAALREAFGHRGFWLLNFGFLACGFQLGFIGSHMPAYLLDKGLNARDAVAGLGIIALANVVGIYYCGYLGGFLRRKNVLSAIYLMRALAMALFVLVPLSQISLYIFCAVMGFIWLGTVPLTNGLVAQVFGVRYIATLFGFVFFGHQVGAFLGIWLGGYVYDATRSYDLIWAAAVLLGVVSAALHYPINDKEIVRLGEAAAAA